MNAYDKTSIQINRCKRILELVDDYVEKQDTATRTALRKALMDEFEAPVIAPPVAAASVDTLPEKECLGGDEAYGDRVYGFTEDQMIAWGAQQRAMQQEENNGIMREWAQRVVSAEDCAEKAEAELANKQAIIDRLMLEYCPDEMTAEQMAEWASHQKRAE